MKKVLIIGLGIGSLYKKVLEDRYEVFTVDITLDKNPTFASLEEALECHRYDLAIICIPNCLHQEVAEELSGKVPVILVEKPGFETEQKWKTFAKSSPSKIIMVKNNLFRENLPMIRKQIKNSYDSIETVNICWINKDRIPNPGSWFTEKEKSFGGVERDLVPHLLGIFYAISPYRTILPTDVILRQNHTLQIITSTEYGSIQSGIYNVSDYCKFDLGGKFVIIADWKSDNEDRIGIEIVYKNGQVSFYEFGLCPEEMYSKMVDEALTLNSDIPGFVKKYKEHNKIDLFIHRIIDDLYV